MAYTAPVGFALEGCDPRLHHEPDDEKFAKRFTSPYSSEDDVPLEAYLYWATVKRQTDQLDAAKNKDNATGIQLPSKVKDDSKTTNVESEETMAQSLAWDLDRDKLQAQRALRSASWQAVFYLITTDILGPSSAPWAFSQMIVDYGK
ncbi:hypothetical protein K7432_016980 [Basidiobolus ranarum]|uniref:Uncharacterized protein n=1 Tax=Basidiobolus ranarum TaxID=34480 RepID=A0ABR2VKX0_9FUNG